MAQNIKELSDVNATDLNLWWANVSLTNLDKQMTNLDIKCCLEVASLTPISSLVPSDKCLHIVVVVSGILSFTCAVLLNLGEIDWEGTAEIRIESRIRVSDLKYAIKTCYDPQLKSIPANNLTLFKVAVFKDPNACNGIYQAVDLGQPILQIEQLLTLFPFLNKGHLQIVIQTGELIFVVHHSHDNVTFYCRGNK